MGVALAAGIAAAGSIGGALLSRQKAPGQAAVPTLDVGQTSAAAIGANSANLVSNENLASSTNSFDQDQATKLLNEALPGFSAAQAGLMSASSQYQKNATSGTLDPSTTSAIQQFAAENGVSRGTAGQFNGFDVVKDFGENLQQYQQSQQNLALSTLSSAYGMAPKVSPMSPSAMFVSPSQALDAQSQNNSLKYNAAQAGLNADAASSNANASLMGGAFKTAAGAFSAYAAMQQPSPSSSGLGQMEQGTAAAQVAFNSPTPIGPTNFSLTGP